MKETKDANETNEPGSKSVSIQISPIHRLGHNGNEWVLWTAPRNPKDKNNIKYNPCYPSTLGYALKLASKDELFEALENYHIFKDLSDKFDELFKDPYENRKTAIATWFDSIVLAEDMQKKYDGKCSELSKLRKEFKEFKVEHGFGGEDE